MSGATVTKDELRLLVREQLEWLEAIHQLAPRAQVVNAISSDQICVYATMGQPPDARSPPPHRYIHVVSEKSFDRAEYGEVLKEESIAWNALTEVERLAAAARRIGNDWNKQKLRQKLVKKGFLEN